VKMGKEKQPGWVVFGTNEYGGAQHFQPYKEQAQALIEGIKGLGSTNFKQRAERALLHPERFFTEGGRFYGASPFMLPLLHQATSLPIIDRPGFEIALANNPDYAKEVLVDCGLNLASRQGPNPYEAEVLADELNRVGIDLAEPRLVPPDCLKVVPDANAEHGLVFKLSEQGRDTAKQRVLNTNDFHWDFTGNQKGLLGAFRSVVGYWTCGSRVRVKSHGSWRVCAKINSKVGSKE